MNDRIQKHDTATMYFPLLTPISDERMEENSKLNILPRDYDLKRRCKKYLLQRRKRIHSLHSAIDEYQNEKSDEIDDEEDDELEEEEEKEAEIYKFKHMQMEDGHDAKEVKQNACECKGNNKEIQGKIEKANQICEFQEDKSGKMRTEYFKCDSQSEDERKANSISRKNEKIEVYCSDYTGNVEREKELRELNESSFYCSAFNPSQKEDSFPPFPCDNSFYNLKERQLGLTIQDNLFGYEGSNDIQSDKKAKSDIHRNILSIDAQPLNTYKSIQSPPSSKEYDYSSSILSSSASASASSSSSTSSSASTYASFPAYSSFVAETQHTHNAYVPSLISQQQNPAHIVSNSSLPFPSYSTSKTTTDHHFWASSNQQPSIASQPPSLLFPSNDFPHHAESHTQFTLLPKAASSNVSSAFSFNLSQNPTSVPFQLTHSSPFLKQSVAYPKLGESSRQFTNVSSNTQIPYKPSLPTTNAFALSPQALSSQQSPLDGSSSCQQTGISADGKTAAGSIQQQLQEIINAAFERPLPLRALHPLLNFFAEGSLLKDLQSQPQNLHAHNIPKSASSPTLSLSSEETCFAPSSSSSPSSSSPSSISSTPSSSALSIMPSTREPLKAEPEGEKERALLNIHEAAVVCVCSLSCEEYQKLIAHNPRVAQGSVDVLFSDLNIYKLRLKHWVYSGQDEDKKQMIEKLRNHHIGLSSHEHVLTVADCLQQTMKCFLTANVLDFVFELCTRHPLPCDYIQSFLIHCVNSVAEYEEQEASEAQDWEQSQEQPKSINLSSVHISGSGTSSFPASSSSSSSFSSSARQASLHHSFASSSKPLRMDVAGVVRSISLFIGALLSKKIIVLSPKSSLHSPEDELITRMVGEWFFDEGNLLVMLEKFSLEHASIDTTNLYQTIKTLQRSIHNEKKNLVDEVNTQAG
eukprot:MONOS_8574.1-p1 / transcript=MONOS_8574.1 / gene=MONOS_8574 / organism=Monocercomonoides_exilis_PA203 / gene_product=unspecified product / transcript_product=unspecified product / location=Mono_scaffold00326:53660-56570(+) / protein_length=921 / sequence_SO=supercontig / SO=protein_coding / is_pseudo=false